MIRKFLSIGFAAVLSISAIAQTNMAPNVPPQVSTALQAQYPTVTNVIWNKEGDYFLPTFTVNGAQNVAYIDLKGHLIQTIVKIKATDLPKAASDYLLQSNAYAQPSEVGRIDFPNNNPSRFYAKVNGHQLLFDFKGNFLKTTESVLKQ